MSIEKDILDRVNISDIIGHYLEIHKKGRNYLAVCPFHNDSNPSLTINDEKRCFTCFACGETGNAITFVEKFKHIPHFEAVKEVAQIAGIEDERLNKNYSNNTISSDLQKIYDCLTEINTLYSVSLYQTDEGKNLGLKYLYDRKLTDEDIKKFNIGYSIKDNERIAKKLSNDGFSLKTIEKTGIGTIYGDSIRDNNFGRVIFGITNENGQIVGFSARRINDNNDEPKYINSPEIKGGAFHKSNILYNFFNAKDEAKRSKYIYVVEGFMDAIAADKAGVKAVVALMGTALTKEHIALLKSLNVEVRLCLDRDKAGVDASIKIIKELKNSGISYKLVDNNQNYDAKDCDELLNKYGKFTVQNYLSNLVDYGDYVLNYFVNNHDMNDFNNRKLLIDKFTPFLKSLKNKLDLDYYVKKISDICDFSQDTILKQLNLDNPDIDIIIDTPQIPEEVQERRELNKSLKQLDRFEKNILHYMLEEKSAVTLYNDKLGYFVNDTYREIANLIQQFIDDKNKDKYDNDDIKDYLDNFDGYDENEKKELKKVINEVSIKDRGYAPYDEKAYKESLEILINKKETNSKEEEYKKAKSTEEKLRLAKELIKQRSERANKK